MSRALQIYNTLSRKKEIFEPLKAPNVGMYVCGPTVYGDAHLGHARPAITFDIVFRYLMHIDYKVRYVRNITDVGHLENDADEGEDKIAKKARLEQLEPMEVVKFYTDRYHQNMDQLNVLHPSIEPTASGHIIEQIEFIKSILENGYAYESQGSVYFDVDKYGLDYNYGKLSGRKTEDLLENTRKLSGQDQKKNSFDFALWKKSDSKHIMHWPSPWSKGYPAWHLECSAMGTKYLGDKIDIHGGGMDLLFPHHESEIAQSNASRGHDPVKYWMHNNMITIDGQKMGKSLNNFITLDEFFTGNHESLEKAYSPMTIRFFILQAHYRSTLDFSNEALQAAEKGMKKLLGVAEIIEKLQPSKSTSINVEGFHNKLYDAINDDFNTPIAIAHLFDLSKIINQVNDGKATLTKSDIEKIKKLYSSFVYDILGLKNDSSVSTDDSLVSDLMETILTLRKNAKDNKDWATADKIRDELAKLNISVKDTKDGADWSID
ncbi:MAG: cysteine--tRNA ligase [Lentimicrobiaceae bacterium]|jgi:cysteinyl-tRNA synthetase|nr:cysteine--tRNA ligase [Lentimicrobiaceae bacterium]MCP4909154.1 cysteine--tRNA ligase [Bacteroidota bacterium]MBT3455197.1 cysteine--tRNA ligase [Lentimicrobiaceae bacterium]MBT3817855.1 cysteine--tRNA ligase [Lentimicrobiaceae bacterium]MBT4061875.1 cysteine--tRNA ligase [Lentimicrobiaceae bacterium]